MEYCLHQWFALCIVEIAHDWHSVSPLSAQLSINATLYALQSVKIKSSNELLPTSHFIHSYTLYTIGQISRTLFFSLEEIIFIVFTSLQAITKTDFVKKCFLPLVQLQQMLSGN